MLKKRVITGLWGILLTTAIVWFGAPWFTILVAMWGLLAVFEFYKMVAASKAPPLTYFGLIWTLLFILSPHFDYAALTPLLLTSAVMLPLIWLLLRPQKERAFASWAWTIAGLLYIGWLLSYLVALRGQPDGRNWIFLALFATFASDTSAFFVGRAIGKHHLAPSISPGKTGSAVDRELIPNESKRSFHRWMNAVSGWKILPLSTTSMRSTGLHGRCRDSRQEH